MNLRDIVSEAKRKGYSKEEIIEILLKKGYSKEEIRFVFNEREESKKGEGRRDNDKEKGVVDENIGFVEKIKLLFSSPNEFFLKVNDKGIGKSCLLLFLVGLICAFIGIFFNLIISRAMYGTMSGMSGGVGEVISGYSVLVLGLSRVLFFVFFIGSFVFAGITNLIVKLFKGNGGYVQTYNALAYGLVSYSLLSLIPVVGFLVGAIYATILYIFGLSAYHKISKGKAVVVVLLPGFIVFALVILIGLLLFIRMRGVY